MRSVPVRKHRLILAAMLFAVPLIAQSGPPPHAEGPPPHAMGPFFGFAVRHDVSARLPELAKGRKPGPPFLREVPLGRRDQPGRPDRVTTGPDRVRQSVERPFPEAASTPLPLSAWQGLSNDTNSAVAGGRVVPPDTQGDVGTNYYVQWINLVFAIYDKSTGAIISGGGPYAGDTIWNGFGGVCERKNDGDPIVLYDHLAGRWFFSQFAIADGVQCVAVTTGSDPRGPYFRWEFEVSPNENNDYPKFGLMPEAYYLSLRDFPSNDGTFAAAVAFDRTAMLAGDPNPTWVKFSMPCVLWNCPDGIQPPHLEGPAPPGNNGYFTRIWDDDFEGPLPGHDGTDGYRIWKLTPDFVTPTNSTWVELPFVSGADFDSTMCGNFDRTCISQPPEGELLDPADELQMYRAQYRHWGGYDTLIVSQTADAGGNMAGVRWAELRNGGGGWVLHQEGTYAPADGEHRWMGSAAMDGSGNIAVGYSVSSSSTYPSVRYTTREAGDPPGTLPGGEVELVAGSDVQTSGYYRWGDYSSMSVDPVDDCTFWYTQEYQADDGDGSTYFDFKTIIGSFKVASCGTQYVCGDGLIEGPEVCDPGDGGTILPDLGGESCTSQGCSGGGTLVCNATCSGFDTAACSGCPVCDNDGVCEVGEDCFNCENDCVSFDVATCGNGVCEPGGGEDCVSCPSDCAGMQTGKPLERFCCGDGDGQNPRPCSDARCNNGFVCIDGPGQTGETTCCGTGVCEAPWEESANCAVDCGPAPFCGDGNCNGTETSCSCVDDCGLPPASEAGLCADGIDNDCNGQIDCDDVACSASPACEPADCGSIFEKKACNAESTCRWDNRNKVCIPN
jgi:hypothetical protein